MARNYDIAEFNLSDDLTPRQVDKLNANFRRLVAMIVNEDAALSHTISDLDFPLGVGVGGTGSVSFPANSLVIGNGSAPLAHLETRRGYLYVNDDGEPAYWRAVDAGDSNWFGNGTPTGSRDPFSGATGEEKEEHLGDLYFNTSTSASATTTLYYYAKENGQYLWKPVTIRAAASVDYNNATNKPTITEADLGISGSGSNRTFGPIGTSTTVTMQGDKSHADYEMDAFTTTELDVIIAMAEAAGPL